VGAEPPAGLRQRGHRRRRAVRGQHSRDRTVGVPAAKVIEHGNSGKGNAIATGLLAAQGDVVVMLDADGSMDPVEILLYVEALCAGPTL